MKPLHKILLINIYFLKKSQSFQSCGLLAIITMESPNLITLVHSRHVIDKGSCERQLEGKENFPHKRCRCEFY
jgi:hypothetical protein